MATATAGPFQLPGVELESWLLKFDKAGACVSPETRAALLARVDRAPDTPVILFSHGWNNDMDEARELYRDFFTSVKSLRDDGHAPNLNNRRFAVLGILWPSKKFDEMVAAASAPGGAQGSASLNAADKESVKLLEQKLEEMKAFFVEPAQHPLRARQVAAAACDSVGRFAHRRLTLTHFLRH